MLGSDKEIIKISNQLCINQKNFQRLASRDSPHPQHLVLRAKLETWPLLQIQSPGNLSSDIPFSFLSRHLSHLGLVPLFLNRYFLHLHWSFPNLQPLSHFPSSLRLNGTMGPLGAQHPNCEKHTISAFQVAHPGSFDPIFISHNQLMFWFRVRDYIFLVLCLYSVYLQDFCSRALLCIPNA